MLRRIIDADNNLWLFAGAILLKGFTVDSSIEFQNVIQQFSPELCDEYRGTSPRTQVPGTDVSSN